MGGGPGIDGSGADADGGAAAAAAARRGAGAGVLSEAEKRIRRREQVRGFGGWVGEGDAEEGAVQEGAA